MGGDFLALTVVRKSLVGHSLAVWDGMGWDRMRSNREAIRSDLSWSLLSLQMEKENSYQKSRVDLFLTYELFP